MDRSSSKQLKDFAAWLVRNESRTPRLTASSRDGRREALWARSHQREGRVDDVTVPEQAVAIAAAGSVSTCRCGTVRNDSRRRVTHAEGLPSAPADLR